MLPTNSRRLRSTTLPELVRYSAVTVTRIRRRILRPSFRFLSALRPLQPPSPGHPPAAPPLSRLRPTLPLSNRKSCCRQWRHRTSSRHSCRIVLTLCRRWHGPRCRPLPPHSRPESNAQRRHCSSRTRLMTTMMTMTDNCDVIYIHCLPSCCCNSHGKCANSAVPSANMFTYVHCVPKRTFFVFACNFHTRQPIFVIFGSHTLQEIFRRLCIISPPYSFCVTSLPCKNLDHSFSHVFLC